MDWRQPARSRSRTDPFRTNALGFLPDNHHHHQADPLLHSHNPSSSFDMLPNPSSANHMGLSDHLSGAGGSLGLENTIGPPQCPPGQPGSPPLWADLHAAGQPPMTDNEAFQQSLIQELMGSYQAQHLTESDSKNLNDPGGGYLPNSYSSSSPLPSPLLGGSATDASLEHCSYGASSSSSVAGDLFPLGHLCPMGVVSDFDSIGFPMRPYLQNSMLGSIPGLNQDFAKLVNAHAEYGSIPRLVRKTSFDETLAHPHHQKPLATGWSGHNTVSGGTDVGTMVAGSSTQNFSDVMSGFDLVDALRPSTATRDERGRGAQTKRLIMTDRPQANANQNFTWDLESGRLKTLIGPLGDYGALNDPHPFGRQSITTNEGSTVTSSPISTGDWLSKVCLSPQDTQTPPGHQPSEDSEVIRWLTGGGIRSSASQSSSGSKLSRRTVTATEASHHTGGVDRDESEREGQSTNEPDTRKGKSPTEVSNKFSGGRGVQVSSIGEARRRTKQLPYSSWDSSSTGSSPRLSSVSINGNIGASGGSVQNSGSGLRTQCLNCKTTETPLWRRDIEGRPLCNACGLFANLHGIPRPAALSTGVIKRRNRVKNGEKEKSNSKSVRSPQQVSKSATSNNSLSRVSQAQKMKSPTHTPDETWLGSTAQTITPEKTAAGLELDRHFSLDEGEDHSRDRLVN